MQPADNLPDINLPVRINRYLALKGFATRREADVLIAAGRVLLNNEPAQLGDKVNEHDAVEVLTQGKPKQYVYFAYHKPRGVITHSPQGDEQDIRSALGNRRWTKDVFPVGRLDKDSSGLIILTNDGRITDRLLNPDRLHEKEYVVTTQKPLASDFARLIASGVAIGDYTTKPCQAEKIRSHAFRIILNEGKKHQIRRMTEALGNRVAKLQRIRIMNIALDDLSTNALRPIRGKELQLFLHDLGLQH